jgi:oxalate decarboxylase
MAAPDHLENPDHLASPPTDAGTIPNLKLASAEARTRLFFGGWVREMTVRELPVAKDLAGVNLRLKPGAIREMHWHTESEWAYVLSGRARVTGLDTDGRGFVEDVVPGDLWVFPPGIPHSIQALEDPCEVLVVLDDGRFSEDETLLVTDWVKQTPTDVLAQNFGVPASAFDGLPADVGRDRYIFPGVVPPPLEREVDGSADWSTPRSFTHGMLAQEPRPFAGGQVRTTDSTNFAAATAIAAALVELAPGGLREMHWHPHADEWQYYISGRGRMAIFAGNGKARTYDYEAGDVGYVPCGMGHCVQNTGDETLVFLELSKSDRFAEIPLRRWMAATPGELVKAHLNIDEETIAGLSGNSEPIVVE